ncbi:EAL domain-containing protein [Tsuneonella sp. CC-YZS046]|uniref:putative bifunctional diguanylate cyclase/phosphodiesterase n=1 Tax=Tsuneonella sp. CC-YZS046 TaxID=3042152 RepID=UPI002D79868E|nr:EAL domain-containing protein [Tsuneonella sp. CC-YZS046]WRO65152.1 EAL domain-containing protein [Tsuneonella sp. CC-YZS046]
MLARLFAGERLREFLLLDLIKHDVAENNREWFARCQLNHTSAFPLALYDLARTAIVALISFSFLPVWATGLTVLAGALLTLAQFGFDRRLKAGKTSYRQLARYFAPLATLRALWWSGAILPGLALAPPEILMPLVLCATLTIPFDALALIAFPRVGIFAVTLQSAAVAAPLIRIGTPAALISAVVLLFTLVFVHWALFNLNYMFATRRLRTKILREANETVGLLLNQYDEDGSDWLVECDSKGRILHPSERFCNAANCTASELEGRYLSDLFLPCPEVDELIQTAFSGQVLRNYVVPLEIKGSRAWWSLNARPTYDREGKLSGWRGFIADITKARVAEDKVTYMAHYDILTNLPNRSLFNTTLQRTFARREEHEVVAVLYVDLDHFKAVNDTHGHALGDKVLAEAARRIEAAVPARNMVARLGGDEFAVLLEDIPGQEEAMAVAEAIVAAMDEPLEIAGQHLPIGASVGVALAPDNGRDGGEVLRAADLALYDAKSKGRRGASLFDPAMQEQAQFRRDLELDLRAAITRGEMQLHYQPLMDVQSGEIAGYEALLRWNHTTHGMIEPGIFIPIAEETGQIVQIGAWVLREAVMEAATWPDHLFVSVNLSPAQIKDEGLLNTIIGALASAGLAPNRLELEITETLLMQDSEENLAILHKIRSLGVNISLDDFGTGYSSLNYLRSFPFDKIKIDRCFVSDIMEREDNEAIVQAVVGLANKLNMRTTAEGVENEEQFARLRDNGCQQVQGFLFSHAKPANQLEHYRGEETGDSAGEADSSPIAKDTSTPREDPAKPGRRKAG